MSVPTIHDRIQSKYGSEYAAIKERLNQAIHHGSWQQGSKFEYIHASNPEGIFFIEDELFNYLRVEYLQGEWWLERHGSYDEEEFHIRIFRRHDVHPPRN